MFGLAFGLLFAAAGLNQYGVIHRMLLEDLEPITRMGSAVMTAHLILGLLNLRGWRTPL